MSVEKIGEIADVLLKNMDTIEREVDKITALNRVLVAALKATLPVLHWSNTHSNRCDEVIEQARAALMEAKR